MNNTKPLPRPTTTRAFLISDGLSPPTVTLHHYLETRRVRIRGYGVCYEHMFRCYRTNTVRRWGLEGPNDVFEVED